MTIFTKVRASEASVEALAVLVLVLVLVTRIVLQLTNLVTRNEQCVSSLLLLPTKIRITSDSEPTADPIVICMLLVNDLVQTHKYSIHAHNWRTLSTCRECNSIAIADHSHQSIDNYYASHYLMYRSKVDANCASIYWSIGEITIEKWYNCMIIIPSYYDDQSDRGDQTYNNTRDDLSQRF